MPVQLTLIFAPLLVFLNLLGCPEFKKSSIDFPILLQDLASGSSFRFFHLLGVTNLNSLLVKQRAVARLTSTFGIVEVAVIAGLRADITLQVTAFGACHLRRVSNDIFPAVEG